MLQHQRWNVYLSLQAVLASERKGLLRERLCSSSRATLLALGGPLGGPHARWGEGYAHTLLGNVQLQNKTQLQGEL